MNDTTMDSRSIEAIVHLFNGERPCIAWRKFSVLVTGWKDCDPILGKDYLPV